MTPNIHYGVLTNIIPDPLPRNWISVAGLALCRVVSSQNAEIINKFLERVHPLDMRDFLQESAAPAFVSAASYSAIISANFLIDDIPDDKRLESCRAAIKSAASANHVDFIQWVVGVEPQAADTPTLSMACINAFDMNHQRAVENLLSKSISEYIFSVATPQNLKMLEFMRIFLGS